MTQQMKYDARVRKACRLSILLLLPGLLASPACSLLRSPEPPPRHVILISVDTLRPDRLGIYGYGRDTSPHIDGFFADKSIYRRAQSSAPCTRPAVLNFLTGALIPDGRLPKPDQAQQSGAIKTLAEILQDRGFRTAAFTANENLTEDRHGRGYEVYLNLEHDGSPQQKQETTYQVTDLALEWLEEHQQEESLHLWVHYFGPHRPFFPPAHLRRYSRASAADERLTVEARQGETRPQLEEAAALDDETVASVIERVPQLAGISPAVHWHLRGGALSPLQVTHFRDSYDDDIIFVDQQVGRLLEKLDALGLAEQSLIVFTSDHGEWLGEDEVWHHCNSLHWRELDVPLLASLNGKPLARAAGPWTATSTLDILPTVVDLLAIDPPHVMVGESLRTPRRQRGTVSFWRGTFAVTKGLFKLYRGEFNGLFDWESDPEELQNLINSAPEAAAELGHELSAYMDDLPSFRQRNQQLIERLRSLGYF